MRRRVSCHWKIIRRGFTLVELLVVVSIIALLAALLMPALKTVIESAKVTRCLSNQRQIATALLFYARDWNGLLPYGVNMVSRRSWDSVLFDTNLLQTSEKRLFYCPSDYLARANPRSYCMNADDDTRVGLGTSFRPGGQRIALTQAPMRCVLLADAGAYIFATLNSFNQFCTDHDNRMVTWNHRNFKASIFSFVDGHSRIVPTSIKAPPGQEWQNQYHAVYTMTDSDDAIILPGRY